VLDEQHVAHHFRFFLGDAEQQFDHRPAARPGRIVFPIDGVECRFHARHQGIEQRPGDAFLVAEMMIDGAGADAGFTCRESRC